jgi:hypothetical protein
LNSVLTLLEEAAQAQRLRQADVAYADAVKSINGPILLLNVALVLTAAVLGYTYKTEDLSDKRGEHPELVPLRNKLADLRRESFALSAEAREASASANAGISRVQHFVHSEPLRGWEAKAERLKGVIPLWRGTNARVRGLDPGSIEAFRQPTVLDLPAVDGQIALREPPQFARLQQEFSELTGAFARLAPRATPAVAEAGAVA